MHAGIARSIMAGVLIAAGAASVSACARQEPLPEASALSRAEVRIAVSPSEPDQLVLGEIYVQTLAEQGRSARLVREEAPEFGTRVDTLDQGSANFLVACTGNTLFGFDPTTARQLERERAEEGDDSDRDFLADTHIAMMNALPTNLTTVDPSSAPGCADSSRVDLPQNFVPVYNKELLNRDERFEVASVTKYLTSDDLSNLVEETEQTGSASRAVAHWLETSTSNPEHASGGDGSTTSDGRAGGDAGVDAGAGSGSGDGAGSTLK